MVSGKKLKLSKHDQKLESALALWPWYQKKRYAFPVIGVVLAVLYAGVVKPSSLQLGKHFQPSTLPRRSLAMRQMVLWISAR